MGLQPTEDFEFADESAFAGVGVRSKRRMK
jgi:hypothetical protein